MKRYSILQITAGLGFLVLLTISCTSPYAPGRREELQIPGSLSVAMGRESQELGASAAATGGVVTASAEEYEITLQRESSRGPSTPPLVQSMGSLPGEPLLFEDVVPGTWSVTAVGRTADGEVVVEGTRRGIIVESQQTVAVTLVLFHVGSPEAQEPVSEEPAPAEEPVAEQEPAPAEEPVVSDEPEPAPAEEPMAAEEPIPAPTALDGFQSAIGHSAISYAEFIVKDRGHNVGSPPFAEYNVNSWNGYLEKHLEAGDVESNLRITAASPHYGSNAIGYENPYSENEHRSVVLNVLNLGVFNYLRNNDPYRSMIPPAIILTRHANFDHGREDDSYIRDNIDILKGVIVFFKPDNRPNDEVQVYYIREDGSKSDLVPIHEILNP